MTGRSTRFQLVSQITPNSLTSEDKDIHNSTMNESYLNSERSGSEDVLKTIYNE